MPVHFGDQLTNIIQPEFNNAGSDLVYKLKLICNAKLSDERLIKRCVAYACLVHATDLVNFSGNLNKLGKKIYNSFELNEAGRVSNNIFFSFFVTNRVYPEAKAKKIARYLEVDDSMEITSYTLHQKINDNSDIQKLCSDSGDVGKRFKDAFAISDKPAPALAG